jgi:hypothetical protein
LISAGYALSMGIVVAVIAITSFRSLMVSASYPPWPAPILADAARAG